jgi:AcrR family transcriptional regulator
LKRRIRLRKEPTQARAKETTDAILEATLQVLVQVGERSLTTTRVAQRAGVSVGTLYQYFPDKASLVMALKVRYLGLMIHAMREALADPKESTLEGILRPALAALLRVKHEHLALTKALAASVERDGTHFVRESLEHFVSALVPILARTLPKLRDVERHVTLLVAALEGAISYAAFEAPEWLASERFLDDLVLLAGGFLNERSRMSGPRRSLRRQSPRGSGH